MARIQGEVKRGALRTLYRQATNAGTSLESALDSFQDSAWSSIQGGRLVTAHTGAGKSVNFALPAIWQSFTQDEFFSLTEELQAVYADALVTLSAQAIADPTDEQIFPVMMADDRLATITSTYKDFTTMRWPTRL